ncbi:protein of unknown function (plasmid) [Acidithiobacillus ferrivorans]|uniref:Uncharacterized protein n=1 Tax=Acidithiobacillus ferrivorans TaxID=160808 RepID=A0A060UTH1_9PROT|nr:hypothetical protein AFERRI_580043 [Acidithiobacillus ferrivorans]SMH67832.1 protein of unknown function [Acidithiobacillus ferrivorans]
MIASIVANNVSTKARQLQLTKNRKSPGSAGVTVDV